MTNVGKYIARLEARLEMLENRLANTASRGVLLETNDSAGIQRQKIMGLAGEEMDKVQSWQPFGLSANCPPGGDVMILSSGGTRDGAQILAASHPDYRQGGGEIGTTTIYDAGGQTIKLNYDGITITDQHGGTVVMAGGGITITSASSLTLVASDVEITSGSLTHNGTNISDNHVHPGVLPGPASTGGPQ